MPSRTTAAVIIFLIGLPPIYAGFRAIANRRRLLVFVCSWLLPILLLFGLLIADNFLFETSDIGMRYGSIFGIWLTVLVTDLVASALFIVLAPRYLLAREKA